MKTTKIATLSLKGVYPSRTLHARMIWQVLFDYYCNNGGDITNMDNMLCDYMSLIKWLDDDYNSITDDFYMWTFTGHHTNVSIGDIFIVLEYGFALKVSRGENSFEIDLLEDKE